MPDQNRCASRRPVLTRRSQSGHPAAPSFRTLLRRRRRQPSGLWVKFGLGFGPGSGPGSVGMLAPNAGNFMKWLPGFLLCHGRRPGSQKCGQRRGPASRAAAHALPWHSQSWLYSSDTMGDLVSLSVCLGAWCTCRFPPPHAGAGGRPTHCREEYRSW